MNVADQTYCIGRGLAAIRFGRADPAFGAHALRLASVALRRVSQGTTFDAVGSKELLALEVWLPPLAEQRRIAEILDTLDEAIQKTEQLIAKLKQMKQGLLHDLLTRGIDENGELRDLERHPELFKDSPVGLIPREWQIEVLGDLAAVVGGVTLGRSVTGPGTVELPYLRVANVQDGYLDLTEIKTVRILTSEEERYALRTGDVLMNEGGDFDKLGRGSVWRGQIPHCLHQNHVFRVRPNGPRLRSDYLASFTASPLGKSYFLRASKQTTNLASINSTQLKAMPVPLPSAQEQARIESALAEMDGRLEAEHRTVSKLTRLKQGLMEDLLTGRVRVTSLLNEAAP